MDLTNRLLLSVLQPKKGKVYFSISLVHSW